MNESSNWIGHLFSKEIGAGSNPASFIERPRATDRED